MPLFGVKVKNLDTDEEKSIQVKKWYDVLMIKDILRTEELVTAPPRCQRLIHANVLLDDHLTVEDLGLESDAALEVAQKELLAADEVSYEEHPMGCRVNMVLELSLASGQYIAAACDDGTIRLLPLTPSGRPGKLKGHHTVAITCLATQEHHLVAGSKDMSVSVWDLRDLKCTKVLLGSERPITCIMLLSDGRVVAGGNQELLVWKVDSTTAEPLKLSGHSGGTTCLAVLSDGSDGAIVSGSDDNTARIWQGGECNTTLTGHSHAVRALKCFGGILDRRIVTASEDKTVRVWLAEDGECCTVLTGHTNWVRCLAVQTHAGGDVSIASGGLDSLACVWHSTPGTLDFELTEAFSLEHEAGVLALGWLSRGRLLTGAQDGSVRVWSVLEEDVRLLEPLHTDWVRDILVSPVGVVATAGYDDKVVIWN